MVWRVLLPTLALLAWPATAIPKDDEPRTRGDHERIQGTWECIATLKDGKQVETYVGVRAVLRGDRLTWTFPQPDGTVRTVKAVFRLDPDQNPKHFDWRAEGKPKEVHKRLYVLEGDTLLWSTNLGPGARPESFTQGQWLFVMKRVKDKD